MWSIRSRTSSGTAVTSRSLLAEVDHRTDFDRTVPRTWNLRRNLDGVVQVTRVDEVEPAELLLRFCVRPVGRGDFPIADADRGCSLRRLQRFAALVVPALLDPLGEGEVFAEDGVGLLLRHRFPRFFVFVDEAEVAHDRVLRGVLR